MNNIIVQKYGGTSVGSPERIKAVAQRVLETEKSGKSVVVVVSAMGDTTDDLIQLAKQISKNPPAREYDALISTGENISAALTAIAINELGKPAISLTGPQAGVFTEGLYSRSKISNINTTRILSELKAGKTVIVTGFQGLNSSDDVTTIGRGGSDTSAVALAAALKATECEIYTDVDGVYTTDPRAVKTAKKLSEIETKLSDSLREKIEDSKTGLGFRPTVRNIIAIILASTEGFIRLMDDVHTKAWDVKYDPVRKNAILNRINHHF